MTSIPIDQKIRLLHTAPEQMGLVVPKKGAYPSVSTVLSMTGDRSGLEAWRVRVGPEEADRIMQLAANRGSAMHAIIEQHFNSRVITEEESGNELSQRLYTTLKPLLGRITPLALEIKLWSDKLQLNGRADCVGYLDGVLSVIDFKSSLKEKREEWITDYFLQAAYYSMMIFELTHVPVTQLAILIAVEQGRPQLFTSPVGDFVESAIKRIRYFQRIQNQRS